MSESKRLFYKEIEEQDANLLVLWRSNPEAYRYFSNPHKITVEGHLRWYQEAYLNDDRRIDYIAYEKHSLRPIGVFGIKEIEPKTIEVSYLLEPVSQGKGYASEAVAWLIQEASKRWDANKIVAQVHQCNIASIRLVERLLFTKTVTRGEFCTYEKEI